MIFDELRNPGKKIWIILMADIRKEWNNKLKIFACVCVFTSIQRRFDIQVFVSFKCNIKALVK